MYRNKLLLRSVVLCGILICAVSAQQKVLLNDRQCPDAGQHGRVPY